MKGWIKLYRQIQSHWLWEGNNPFDKRSAWVDILLMVNHKEKKVNLGNELFTVKPGEKITSERKLADRWGWSRTKVRNFLELLENDEMIEIEKTTKKTTLKVCNYSDYQNVENNKKTTKKPKGNHEKTSKKHQKNTNKNVKNLKNVKNEKNDSSISSSIGNFLEKAFGRTISPIEIEALQAYQEDLSTEIINYAIQYSVEKGATTINFIKTILNYWVKEKVSSFEEADMAIKKWKEEQNGKYPANNRQQDQSNKAKKREPRYTFNKIQ